MIRVIENNPVLRVEFLANQARLDKELGASIKDGKLNSNYERCKECGVPLAKDGHERVLWCLVDNCTKLRR